ncbi:hypothetical protein K413DRAFT_4741 [Clostridium sp. ASBs410]|nr:hypothetical protein K413DRAFT_4741 [Clostridium sp. ASBs410]
MGLELMKERIKKSGLSVREELIKDARQLLESENQNDSSYCPTMYKLVFDKDATIEEKINPRLYYKKYSSSAGKTQKIQTVYSEKFEVGDCFYDSKDSSYWICTEAFDNDDISWNGKLAYCNYKLHWQNESGEIISRYARILNASAYNNGEKENKTLTLQSNQFMVYLPYDNETMLLDDNKRIHMSKNIRKCKPYEITRIDDISYDFTDKGLINLIFTQVQASPTTDKLVDDGTGNKVWICDYNTPSSPTDPGDENGNQSPILLQATFTCKGDKIIKAGGSAKTFSVSFSGENQVPVTDVDYIWSVSITKEFNNLLTVETLSNGQCKVKLGYDDLVVGNYVRLSVVNSEGTEIGYELIEIGGNL